ncbi:hypothetical protein [Hungatella effluvii]|uniref:hypothetical protein n=1 Tax=Hungatella effluvii TaxID=1096246 RepID=UPI0022E6FA5F|nr:hypothetical protein [Hungatella effluvii]
MTKIKLATKETIQPEVLYQKFRHKNPNNSKTWGGILFAPDTEKCVFVAKGYTFPIVDAKMELSYPDKGIHLFFATSEMSKKNFKITEGDPDLIAIIAVNLTSGLYLTVKWGTDYSYDLHPEDRFSLKLQIMGDARKYNFPGEITTLQFFLDYKPINGDEPIIYYCHEADPACQLLNQNFFAKEDANDNIK